MSKRVKKYRIGLDFDGVLHSYTSGYTGIRPQDSPVPGSVEFVRSLVDAGYECFVFTARLAGENFSPEHALEIYGWLRDHKFPDIPITGEKLHADLYIDDRGYRFTGSFDELSFRLAKPGGGLLMSWVDKT